MNSTEKILRLQGGYRNTEVPYDIEAIKKNIKERNQPSINDFSKPLSAYVKIPKEYRSFNVYRETDDEMANYYIQKLKYYKENDKIMLKKSINYILDIMNSYNPPSWIITVYKYLERNNYI